VPTVEAFNIRLRPCGDTGSGRGSIPLNRGDGDPRVAPRETGGLHVVGADLASVMDGHCPAAGIGPAPP